MKLYNADPSPNCLRVRAAIQELPIAPDFAVAASFGLRKQAQISLEETANVEAWIERFEALPSWQRAVLRSSF